MQVWTDLVIDFLLSLRRLAPLAHVHSFLHALLRCLLHVSQAKHDARGLSPLLEALKKQPLMAQWGSSTWEAGIIPWAHWEEEEEDASFNIILAHHCHHSRKKQWSKLLLLKLSYYRYSSAYKSETAPTVMTLSDYVTSVIGDNKEGTNDAYSYSEANHTPPPYIFAESKPLGSKKLVDIFPEVFMTPLCRSAKDLHFFLFSLEGFWRAAAKSLSFFKRQLLIVFLHCFYFCVTTLIYYRCRNGRSWESQIWCAFAREVRRWEMFINSYFYIREGESKETPLGDCFTLGLINFLHVNDARA